MTLHVLILGAGQSKRMKSSVPKILHHLAGKPLIDLVIDEAKTLDPTSLVVVLSPLTADIYKRPDITIALQTSPLGTGDAVRLGLKAILKEKGDVLVLYGDVPLLKQETLKKMIDLYKSFSSPCFVNAVFKPKDPAYYGRCIINTKGCIERIVEYKDTSFEEKTINVCNSGILLGNQNVLENFLLQLTPYNSQKEYYLTDIIEKTFQENIPTFPIEIPEEEVLGVNTKEELSNLEELMQNRLRIQAMGKGVSFIDPQSVFLNFDTVLEPDVIVEPFVTFGSNVKVSSFTRIRSFSHIEHTTIASHCVIGPFAHLRGNNILEERVEIGNFVELKKTHMKTKSKAKHLSYLGDATIGSKSNIGAGTITCNYDGQKKTQTIIEDDVFVGSNTALVAPVHIGHQAFIAAGSVITQNVPDKALALARSRQEIKSNWAKKHQG